MIYCVIPPEWVDDLYDTLVAHYAGNPDVTVIVDRRKGERRGSRKGSGQHERLIRDRRRPRIVGTFPTLDVADV